MTAIQLLPPAPELLPGYEAALATGWSPDTGRDISRQQLDALRREGAIES